MSQSKRCLVYGGAGFIGTNLCRRLLTEGHQVTCVDDLSTGKQDNILPLMMDCSRFEFHQCDVRDPLPSHVLSRGSPWDWAFHLASPASPPAYQRDPLKTISSNIDGLRQLCEMARQGLIGRILMASTSEVYGDPQRHPQSEDYRGNVNFLGPRSCYDESKRLAETLCLEYARAFQLEIRLVRLFNTFGPYLAPGDGRLVSNLISQRLRGEPMTIHGDGLQTRSLIYVDDTIEGIMKAMSCENGLHPAWFLDCPPTLVGPINLGASREMQVTSIASLIVELIPLPTGDQNTTVNLAPSKDDPMRRCPDISCAQQLLDWKPVTSLQEGIVKYAEWMREGLEFQIPLPPPSQSSVQ